MFIPAHDSRVLYFLGSCQMRLSVVSWNLCGLGKIFRWPNTAQWFMEHDIMMVQESLQVTKTYPMIDVTRYCDEPQSIIATLTQSVDSRETTAKPTIHEQN